MIRLAHTAHGNIEQDQGYRRTPRCKCHSTNTAGTASRSRSSAFDDKVKVETEILLPPDVDDRDGDRSWRVARISVSVAALEDIHKEAFESAKRTIDVLIAEQSAPRDVR